MNKQQKQTINLTALNKADQQKNIQKKQNIQKIKNTKQT